MSPYETTLLDSDVNVGIFVVLMTLVYAATMIWFTLHKRNPKNEGKTFGGFMYSWPTVTGSNNFKPSEPPITLDYSSWDDG